MKRRAAAPVLRWSPTTWRRIEALRDRILFGAGTSEPFIAEDIVQAEAETGRTMVAMHWRKPLSLMEVNRMAPRLKPSPPGTAALPLPLR